MSSFFAGAVMIAFFAPASRCARTWWPSVKTPVDSITRSTPRLFQGRRAGSFSEKTLISKPFTRIFPSPASTFSENCPYVVSYCSRWALVCGSAMSLMPTTDKTSLCRCSIARKHNLPIRPKPLIPTRAAMSDPSSYLRHQIAKLFFELLGAKAAGAVRRSARQSGEALAVLEILSLEPDHVFARDFVRRLGHIDQANLGPAGGGVEQIVEVEIAQFAIVEAHQGAVIARRLGVGPQEEIGRAVAERAHVFAIERERVGAADLVADILVRDADALAALGEAALDLRFQDERQVHVGEPQVAVVVAGDAHSLDRRHLFRRQPLEQPFGDERDAVDAAQQRLALEDRPFEKIAQRFEPDGPFELLRNHRERCARRLADAERQVAGGAAHDDDEIPAPRRARVFHQILHEGEAQVARGLEAECWDVARQRQVVVDGFRNVADAQPSGGPLGQFAGAEHRVIAADGGEIADLQLGQRREDGIEVLGLFGRVGARSVENRSALEMDARHLVAVQKLRLVGIARHEPVKAVENTDDLPSAAARLEGDRADNAVDAGSWSAADENADSILSVAFRTVHDLSRTEVDLGNHPTAHAGPVKTIKFLLAREIPGGRGSRRAHGAGLF